MSKCPCGDKYFTWRHQVLCFCNGIINFHGKLIWCYTKTHWFFRVWSDCHCHGCILGGRYPCGLHCIDCLCCECHLLHSSSLSIDLMEKDIKLLAWHICYVTLDVPFIGGYAKTCDSVLANSQYCQPLNLNSIKEKSILYCLFPDWGQGTSLN